jgi:uncharacterized protein DUF1553/uncharacterized protein DUF1549
MIRLTLAAALAAGLLWAATGFAPAQDAKPGVSPQTEKINDFMAKGWESKGITKPAVRAKDDEFMRRVFIDLIGRIPTPEEIIDFENDRAANKRARLVSRLLYETSYIPKDAGGRPLTDIPGLKFAKTTEKGPSGKDRERRGINYNDAYAENFADLWTTWMLTRSNTHPIYREQFHIWLTQQFAKPSPNAQTEYPEGKPWNRIVYDLVSATGKSNSNGSVVFVIRHLGDPIVTEPGQRTNYGEEGKFDAVPITSRVTKLFLGIQSQCVQCHDHPFHKEYIQSDFWGVNAFFRQTDRSGTTNPRNLAVGITPPPLSLSDMDRWNEKGMVLYERRDGQRRASFPVMLRDLAQFERGDTSSKRLVSGSIPENLTGRSRREVLAQWIIEHDNFGRAFVNRMWGHLFGRGLHEEPAVDDFNSNNKLVHAELLDYLAEEFRKYNYDPKKLLEWICTSDAYNLSHVASPKYADHEFDPYFARMPLKAMSPEVLFDSLAIATRAEARKNPEQYRALKNSWGQKLTQNFGDDEGNEVSFNGTVVQALLMMNGREINGEIGGGGIRSKGPNGLVAEIVAKHGGRPARIYDELFLMTLSRHPTSTEIATLNGVRDGTTIKLGVPAPPTSPPKGSRPPKGTDIRVPAATNDVEFYQDVFWALLNSNEFMLNH